MNKKLVWAAVAVAGAPVGNRSDESAAAQSGFVNFDAGLDLGRSAAQASSVAENT